jgi:hypothetical protein
MKLPNPPSTSNISEFRAALFLKVIFFFESSSGTGRNQDALSELYLFNFFTP